MFRALLLLSCLICLNPNAFSQTTSNSCEDRNCIAVIDAGSTGSRLHIYAYDLDASQSPIQINEVWNKKIKPGFASIEANKASINAYLSTLMSDSPVQNIPVYFYATAGMRLLSAQKQKIYYQEVQSWFSQKAEWKLIEAKTITGTEEALYDWLSVNYTLGTLNSDAGESVGVMDMGGASVQIVFPSTHTTTHPGTNSEIEIDLYGKHHVLSVHSFLGLGQTEMSHQFLNSVSCFSNEYPLPDGAAGAGNAQVCETEVSSLMNAVHGVHDSIAPLLAANHVDTWYAIGGISNLASMKLFQFDNQQLTLKQLIEQADNSICQQPWHSLNEQFPNDDYLYQYCLSSAYFYALVVDGYGLTPNEPIHYFPAEKNIDWTTGVVLHH